MAKKILVSLVIFLIIILFPQAKNDSVVVKEYIQKIDSINNLAKQKLESPDYNYKIDPVKQIIEEMNLADLKHIVALMYKATDLEYIRLENLGTEQYFKVANSKIPGESGLNLNGTAIKIQTESKDRISPLVYGLTRVAYFLRINIYKTEVKHLSDEQMKIPADVIDAKITQVYKGNGRFQTGDSVQFYYNGFWHKEPHSFKAGEEYIVPLEPRGKYPTNDSSIIALVPYLDDSNGYFPVIDSELIDKYDFFGFGDTVPIDLFNKELEQKIKDIELW